MPRVPCRWVKNVAVIAALSAAVLFSLSLFLAPPSHDEILSAPVQQLKRESNKEPKHSAHVQEDAIKPQQQLRDDVSKQKRAFSMEGAFAFGDQELEEAIDISQLPSDIILFSRTTYLHLGLQAAVKSKLFAPASFPAQEFGYRKAYNIYAAPDSKGAELDASLFTLRADGVTVSSASCHLTYMSGVVSHTKPDMSAHVQLSSIPAESIFLDRIETTWFCSDTPAKIQVQWSCFSHSSLDFLRPSLQLKAFAKAFTAEYGECCMFLFLCFFVGGLMMLCLCFCSHFVSLLSFVLQLYLYLFLS